MKKTKSDLGVIREPAASALPLTKLAKKLKSHGVTPRFKLWLELDGQRVFCAGVCQILQEVEQTGSIKDAAAAMGRSYRFVWGRLKEAESSPGKPLVETRVGGELAHRSNLTPAGKKLVNSYQQLRKRLFEVVDREFAKEFSDLRG